MPSFDVTARPQNLTEAEAHLRAAVFALAGHTRTAITVSGPQIAGMVATAFSHTGSGDAEATSRGADVLRAVQKADAAVTDLIAQLRFIGLRVQYARSILAAEIAKTKN